MILTKKYLNEIAIEQNITDNMLFESYKKRGELSTYDIFVSYSWHDRSYAAKVVYLLEKCGHSVYIDYEDGYLDRDNVNSNTVKRITKMMDKCRGLIYLHSPSSSVSKWCPWEIGYFSGKKSFKCAYLPLLDKENEEFINQEYLKIYPYCDYEKKVDGTKYFFWITEFNNKLKYTTLKQWLNGELLKINER